MDPSRTASFASTLRRVTVQALLSAICCAMLAGLGAQSAAARGEGLYGFEPFTPWRLPPVYLPAPRSVGYTQLAERGLGQAHRWAIGGWYCEYLGCSSSAYPLATIWATVPLFQTVSALQLTEPTWTHRALVEHIGQQSERFWDRALGGYAPYPGDRAGNVEAWFDDNGWLGLAFVQAYRATGDGRFLGDAQRAFNFIAARGWDSGSGGMWWTTNHPYHSGPALASDVLLAVLLYQLDHNPAQLEAAKTWVDWANSADNHDERRLYLEQTNQPESVNDYVQSPMIYAQYLMCKDGLGQSYCDWAGRVAATMAERRVNKNGYRFNYGPQYDVIYLQWMMAYGAATNEPYWLQLAKLNAAAAERHATGEYGLWLGSWWGGRIGDPETHPGMFRTMAATTDLFAETALYAGTSPAIQFGPPTALASASGHRR